MAGFRQDRIPGEREESGVTLAIDLADVARRGSADEDADADQRMGSVEVEEWGESRGSVEPPVTHVALNPMASEEIVPEEVRVVRIPRIRLEHRALLEQELAMHERVCGFVSVDPRRSPLQRIWARLAILLYVSLLLLPIVLRFASTSDSYDLDRIKNSLDGKKNTGTDVFGLELTKDPGNYLLVPDIGQWPWSIDSLSLWLIKGREDESGQVLCPGNRASSIAVGDTPYCFVLQPAPTPDFFISKKLVLETFSTPRITKQQNIYATSYEGWSPFAWFAKIARLYFILHIAGSVLFQTILESIVANNLLVRGVVLRRSSWILGLARPWFSRGKLTFFLVFLALVTLFNGFRAKVPSLQQELFQEISDPFDEVFDEKNHRLLRTALGGTFPFVIKTKATAWFEILSNTTTSHMGPDATIDMDPLTNTEYEKVENLEAFKLLPRGSDTNMIAWVTSMAQDFAVLIPLILFLFSSSFVYRSALPDVLLGSQQLRDELFSGPWYSVDADRAIDVASEEVYSGAGALQRYALTCCLCNYFNIAMLPQLPESEDHFDHGGAAMYRSTWSDSCSRMSADQYARVTDARIQQFVDRLRARGIVQEVRDIPFQGARDASRECAWALTRATVWSLPMFIFIWQVYAGSRDSVNGKLQG